MARILLLLLIFCLTVLALNAQPCSCKPQTSPRAELDARTAVFGGKVSRIERVPAGYKITFAVHSAWKGINQNAVTLITATDACGYTFIQGANYLIYAYGNPDELQTNLCTRTTLWQNADFDLSKIGPSIAAR